MKRLELVFAIVIIALFALIWVFVTEMNDRNRVLQSEIEGLKRENQAERDSLNKTLLLTRDSLSIAFETIRIANKERQEAHERTQRIIRNYEKIIFVTHTDSSRTATLKQLYPTFNP